MSTGDRTAAPIDLDTLSDAALFDAAVSADAWLVFQAAKAYGLVTGGPDFDVGRCEQAIELAHQRGLTWTADERDQRIVALVGELTAGVGHVE